MDKKSLPQWLGRPILDVSHHGDLEQRAAINEFQHKMPRAEAEQKAHDDYKKDHRQRSMAHHLDGLRAAEAVGDKESAFRSWLLYDLHAKALGLDSVGPVAPEIQTHVDAEDKKSRVKFKAHPADIFALQDQEKDETKEPDTDTKKSEVELELDSLQKSASEGHICQWRLGERKCKNWGSRKGENGKRYCHAHEHHWANKISQKESKESVDMDAKEMTGTVGKSEVELELEAVKLVKGDVIQFPGNPSPAKDLGQDASVIAHPVHAIQSDAKQQIAALRTRAKRTTKASCKKCGQAYSPAAGLQAKVSMCEKCHPKLPEGVISLESKLEEGRQSERQKIDAMLEHTTDQMGPQHMPPKPPVKKSELMKLDRETWTWIPATDEDKARQAVADKIRYPDPVEEVNSNVTSIEIDGKKYFAIAKREIIGNGKEISEYLKGYILSRSDKDPKKDLE